MTKSDPHPARWHIIVPSKYVTQSEPVCQLQKPLQTSCWFMSSDQTPKSWSKKAMIERQSRGTGPPIRDILSKLAHHQPTIQLTSPPYNQPTMCPPCQYPQLLPLIFLLRLVSCPLLFLSYPITLRYVLQNNMAQLHMHQKHQESKHLKQGKCLSSPAACICCPSDLLLVPC